MGSKLGGGTAKGVPFVRTLGALKRRGSNVLVVGGGSCEPHETVCERFMGDDSRVSRRRLVVSTNPECVRGHESCRTERRKILLLTDDRTAGELADDDRLARISHLDALAAAFLETVDEFEADSPLDPSELRVCVDSVSELLDAYDTENVFRLLHAMTTRIRRSRGMGHFHLPIDPTDEAVRLYEPLFDAVITLRTNGERVEHRWNLRDRERKSGWISL